MSPRAFAPQNNCCAIIVAKSVCGKTRVRKRVWENARGRVWRRTQACVWSVLHTTIPAGRPINATLALNLRRPRLLGAAHGCLFFFATICLLQFSLQLFVVYCDFLCNYLSSTAIFRRLLQFSLQLFVVYWDIPYLKIPPVLLLRGTICNGISDLAADLVFGLLSWRGFRAARWIIYSPLRLFSRMRAGPWRAGLERLAYMKALWAFKLGRALEEGGDAWPRSYCCDAAPQKPRR